MKTLTLKINLFLATLCLLTSAVGFFGSLFVGHLFQAIIFGVFTVLAIAMLKLTTQETE
jgi:hypothetical protein